MRKLNCTDHLELAIAKALHDRDIDFIHESESKGVSHGLDFYLPEYDVYLEVKQFHADRIGRQMASQDNVIAIQGMKSLEFFIELLYKSGAIS